MLYHALKVLAVEFRRSISIAPKTQVDLNFTAIALTRNCKFLNYGLKNGVMFRVSLFIDFGLIYADKNNINQYNNKTYCKQQQCRQQSTTTLVSVLATGSEKFVGL